MARKNETVKTAATDEEFLRVGRFAAKRWKIHDVRKSDVPKTYVLYADNGITFYADYDDIARFLKAHPPPCIHGPFPPAARKQIEHFAKTDALGWSPEGWELYLRAAKCPWVFLAKFELIPWVIKEYARKPLTQSRCLDVYLICLRVWHGPPGPVEECGTVSAAQAARIAKALRSDTVQASLRNRIAEFRTLMTDGVVKPDRVTIGALTDEVGGPNLMAPFDPIDLLAAAPQVVAVRTDTGKPLALFRPRSSGRSLRTEFLRGPDLPAEYQHPNPALPPGALTVELDSDAELIQLASLVQSAKGPMATGKGRRLKVPAGPLLPTGLAEV